MKKLIGFVVTGFFVLLSGVAGARPGCVYQDAHLRIGPGGGYPLIGTIPGPTPVVLVRLGQDWSIVSYDGETGYVAIRHLTGARNARPDPPPSRSSTTSDPVLVREIDPLFGAAWLSSGRFGPRSRELWSGGGDYFGGFRRSAWTDRTNWRRAQNPTSGDAANSLCALGSLDEPRRVSSRRGPVSSK